MAQVFKNKYALDIGTTFVELYSMTSEDVTYSIISGMTISNKKLNEILINVRIIDSTNTVTCYLVSDSKLSVGSTLLLAGDLQKIILKPGDSIEISSSEAASVDVTMAIIENDTSISYIITDYPPWVGDFAFITAGLINEDNVSTYVFSTSTATANIGSLTSTNFDQSAGASNSITGLTLGGYTNTQISDIKAFLFSSKTWTYFYSDLGNSLRLGGSASNGTQWLYMGGYDGSAEYLARKGDFASGSTGTFWGNTRAAYYSCGSGNSIYALQFSGYSATRNVDYFVHATQSDYTFWGEKRLSAYKGAGASNEERALYHESGLSVTPIETFEYASQGNYISWGDLSTVNSEMGAVSSGLEVLFTSGGNSGSSGELASLTTGGVTTRINGIQNFNGGNPISESGNG